MGPKGCTSTPSGVSIFTSRAPSGTAAALPYGSRICHQYIWPCSEWSWSIVARAVHWGLRGGGTKRSMVPRADGTKLYTDTNLIYICATKPYDVDFEPKALRLS